MIRGSQNPFSCSPVIVSEASGIIALGTVSRVGNVFTFSTGFVWRINGVVYQNTVPFIITVPPATEGFNRTDIARLNTSNGIERIQGVESVSIALTPIAPSNAVVVTSWSISGDSVSDPATDQTVSNIYAIGELQIFKIAPNTNNKILEVGDYCIGAVEGQFINANYLGGNPTLLSSFNI
jgi:hypothetical protein